MRIAIVGSGVSGIAALWLLNEYSDHEVNIYEKDDRPGGHTNSVEFTRKSKESCMVDTGFIVLNPPTYPNFLRFLQLKKIPLLSTAMTFSVSRDRGVFEWAGEGLGGVFCQLGNLLNPRLYRMVFDVLRFNLFALDLLKEDHSHRKGNEMSIGEYLDREGYSEGFKEDYLLPMTGAIWSTPVDKAALDFPATTLVRFFHNHHLLQLEGKPKWLTVQGGSKKYIDAVLSKLPPENLHLSTEIKGVSSSPDGVILEEASGRKHLYDHVIMATHSDTTLSLLRHGGEVRKEEEEVLAPWEWGKNEAVLHWDERFMPIRRRAYSAWNYSTSTRKKSPHAAETSTSHVDTVSLTYSMNILQHLPEKKHGQVLVTLNPPFPVDPAKTVAKFNYDHPLMTTTSVATQTHISSIQNTRGISYVGAWTKYGFHEDGFTSAFKLVTSAPFNVEPPFPFKPAIRYIPTPGVIEKTARGLVVTLEGLRRRGEVLGIWVWVSWAMCLLLVWVEQLLGSVGWQTGMKETARISSYWVDHRSRAKWQSKSKGKNGLKKRE